MGLKRKDFQKAAAFLKEFLLKLNEDIECAELRDTLTLALLHMQKYYRLLQCRTQERTSQHQLTLSARGLSPMTPFVDAPDKFQWKWISLDSAKYLNSLNQQDEGFYHLPDIILAIREGNTEWINKIIQQDSTLLDERDSLGRSGLFYAIHYNLMNILKFLLHNGADPNVVAHDGTSPVHKACHDGNHIALELLIEHGGDIHAQDTQLRAPIHWAVTTPGLECLQKLIKNKADVSARDKDGLTPCMWACRMDHKNHFEMLYKSDKHLSNSEEYETDDSGRTWLHWAVRRTEPLKCLQLLLSKESAALKDEDGKTVILVAAELGSFPACKLIFELSGPHVVYDCDNMNRTALHLATIRGHGTVLNFLLENGADLEMRDRFQATAWDYAKNKQLHYCQLIMMSHKRQSLQSSPRDSRSNGDVIGTDGNLEPWMKSQENAPNYAPGRNRYNLSLTDRSNNSDVTSKIPYNRNSIDVIMNKNNNNSNKENYQIKNNNNNINDNITGSKSRQVKINHQRVQVHGAGNPAYSKMSNKENEVHPVKDLISSPCPPKKPRTGKCSGRSSFHHRSLSESFDQHFSNTQSVDYAEMDPVEMSRSEGTESRLGVYERSITLDNQHMPHDQDLENCAYPEMHPDSNDEIEVVSDEMDVSNIDEDDQPSSRVEGNFSHDNQNTDPGLPYPPQNSPSAPLLGEITPHPELSNEERPEVNNSFMGVAFPYPRPPPPPPITNTHKGSHPSVILLNRRPLLSRNPPKSQPLPKQHSKQSSSSSKASALRQMTNPQMVNNYRPEVSHKGKVLNQPSLGSDTSEEQYEHPNSSSWQGLASVPINSPAAQPVPMNPILSQQEPLPKFLHRASIPPPGKNSLIGNNPNNNAWPSDRPGNSDLTLGNLKLTEMSDIGLSALESKPGLKGGTTSQQHLSPSSSTSSLSLAQNKSSSANGFQMSSQPTGPGLGGQKNDIRRLPSALIPLTQLQPQGQPISKKKKKRKKQTNQELLFENTVVEGKSLQNSVLSNPISVKPLAPTGLTVLTEESKADHFKQRMEPSMLNSQKKLEIKSVDGPFTAGSSNPNKGRNCVSGLQMIHSTLPDTQNSRLQKEVCDDHHMTPRDDCLNNLTTVGTSLSVKKSASVDSKQTMNNLLPSNSEEAHQDFVSGKSLPVPIAREKWSLPENGLRVSSKKQSNPPSPFSLVEPEVIKTKPPLPHTRKSLLR